MKKIIALLVLALALPPLTAYAASVTSKSFVVRNWKATPASTGEVEIGEETEPEEEEREEQAEPEGEPTIPPDDELTLTTPPSTTPPAFTGELESGETGEPEEPEEQEEQKKQEGEPVEQAIFFGDEFRKAGPVSTDGVEMGEQIETEKPVESEEEPEGTTGDDL